MLLTLNNETQEHLISEAKRYQDMGCNFRTYNYELGYEAWMDDFCASDDGITEAEARRIEDILEEAWREAKTREGN